LKRNGFTFSQLLGTHALQDESHDPKLLSFGDSFEEIEAPLVDESDAVLFMAPSEPPKPHRSTGVRWRVFGWRQGVAVISAAALVVGLFAIQQQLRKSN
jgi:hypothetical protein